MRHQKPLILVDGSSYLFRAYHTMNFTTSDGKPTGAIYGVINMLKSLFKQYQPEHIAVVFDAKGKTFRNDVYSDYKANRPPMPDDLREQIEPLHQIIEAMGLPLLCVEGVEADDVIGTLAHQATTRGIDTLISTGDKDMAQLVNEHIHLINTMTDQYLNPQGVQEKFGLPPERIIDYLALMGDKVDNIPGVPGVGEKTALALIQGLGGIDDIYANLDRVAELPIRGAKSLGAKLAKYEAEARLSYELATIKCDVDLPFDIEQLHLREPNRERLLQLFEQCEFRRWTSELKSGQPVLPQGEAKQSAEEPVEASTSTVQRDHYETLLDEASFEKWLQKLGSAELIAIDTETTSLNVIEAELVGISFAVAAGEAAYLPLAHQYPGAPSQLDKKEVLAKLKPILESESIGKVGQNIKYDRNIFAAEGIHLKGIKHDTMLESYCLNSVANRHDMDTLAQKFLGHECISYETIAGKGKKQLTFDQIPLETAAPYAAEDADVTWQLHQTIYPQLAQAKGPLQVYEAIEMPLLSVLADMEKLGVLIDAEHLQQKSQEFAERMHELEQKAYDIAGQEFNLGSPKQLQEILYDKLGLPVLKRTPKKQPSTAEEVLMQLALDYPLPKLILEHRSLSKLKSTYSDKLPQMISPKTGRVHTSYHQAVAATGRLSSSDPNLQNIPIKTPEGRSIREAFIAPEGYKILAADYSQIELRIMAHLSQDENLLRAFADNLDIHRATAAEVFGVSVDAVTAEQRRHAKAVNFGLIYGMSRFGLAKQLQIDNDEAAHYIDTYFARYPGVAEYMESTKQKARELGYVETLFGRRLYLPQINARNGMHRQAAERTAINAPMQGSAADIIKIAMLAVHNWIQSEQPDCKMIMQVHDELVFEVAADKVDECREKICQLMSEAVQLSVPLLVEAGVGDNWEQAH